MNTDFKYAIRNLTRNKTNSIITVIGLSVALACCLLIYVFVQQEKNYNAFHVKADRIYKLNHIVKYTNETDDSDLFQPEIARRIEENAPQVELATSFRHATDLIFDYKNEYFQLDLGIAGENFFEVFSFPLMEGDDTRLLENSDGIWITERIAKMLVPKNESLNSIIGKTINFPMGYNVDFTISGILKNVSSNSSLRFEAIIPDVRNRWSGYCVNSFGFTNIYYLLQNNTQVETAQKSIHGAVDNYYEATIKNHKNRGILVNSDDAVTVFSLPLTDVYFNGVGSCFAEEGSERGCSILTIIAVIILIIACSNYTILSLGQYLKKLEEVSVRKAIGAKNVHVFKIYFLEGLTLTLLSLVVGLAFYFILVPVFSRLAQTQIFTELINIPQVISFIVLAVLSIVVFTSLIPVLVLTGAKSVGATSSNVKLGSKAPVSQIFVALQYSLSIILIILTLFIVKQHKYLKNKDLGLDAKHVLNVELHNINSQARLQLRDKLQEHAGVLNITLTSRNFMDGRACEYVRRIDGEQILVNRFKVDQNYASTLGLQIVEGSDLTETDVRSGSKAVLVNETFTRMVGIEDDPINFTFQYNGRQFRIKGVVKDYNYYDLKQSIEPALLFARTDYGNSYSNILLKYHSEQLERLLKHLNKTYADIAPGKELTYNFWDEDLANRYLEEERWSKIIGYTALIAILISSLGLFGLTILLVNQRIKEIGVRKVVGARSEQVLVTVNKSFVMWLSGSIILSAPLAHTIVTKWLATFPYKVETSWWIFALAGLITLAIAVATVSIQCWQAANRNPVEALRYE